MHIVINDSVLYCDSTVSWEGDFNRRADLILSSEYGRVAARHAICVGEIVSSSCITVLQFLISYQKINY